MILRREFDLLFWSNADQMVGALRTSHLRALQQISLRAFAVIKRITPGGNRSAPATIS
jgi:hypothetical protein